MPKKADTTSAAQRHPETPPSPASVRASTPAGWLPPRPTRRPTGRLWRQGRRTPGRCPLSDRVARQPRSTRRHLQLPASLPFAWHSNPRQAPLLPDPAQSGAQRNGHGLGPRPTGPRYGSGGHSHLVRRHAYLSCSMSSAEKKTPHHILWLWSHSRCAFVVQKCEGRARFITNPSVLCHFLRLLSTKAPSLPRHYPASSVLRASPPPQTVRPVSRELPVDRALRDHRWGFPCCVWSPVSACRRQYPAGPMGLFARPFPLTFGFPRINGGSAPALFFSRPAQRSLSLQPAYSPSRLQRPSTPEASVTSLPPPLLRLLPGGANQFPGGTFPRCGPAPFHGAR